MTFTHRKPNASPEASRSALRQDIYSVPADGILVHAPRGACTQDTYTIFLSSCVCAQHIHKHICFVNAVRPIHVQFVYSKPEIHDLIAVRKLSARRWIYQFLKIDV